MITLRPSNQRGHFDHQWLKTFHTFSFGEYFDEAHMGHKSLRVINEDWIQPALGFGTHGHQNMEILTYVISGALAHKDSMGNGSTIRPGDIQYMSAGKGVRHSEFNQAENEATHLMQIWLLPHTKETAPAYDQKTMPAADKQNALQLLASGDGALGSIKMLNHSRLYAAHLDTGKEINYQTKNPDGYIQVINGTLLANQIELQAGDGAYITQESALHLKSGKTDVEFLLFDLA